jgi:Flp pilus assembly pilin Flp
MNRQTAVRFWHEETGQDLVEYSLLLASIALAGAAIFIAISPTMRGLWTVANSRLNAASN